MTAKATETGIHRLLQGLDVVPQLARMLEEQGRMIKTLLENSARASTTPKDSDGWLDAKAAAEYLSVSKGTFDAYRYQRDPKPPGHKLGGKTFYKKTDLDSWVRLYELKSAGLA